MKFHPDVHPDNKKFYEEKIKKILDAYKFVMEEAAKAENRPDQTFPESADEEFAEDSATMEVLLIRLSNRSLALPTRHIREIIRVGDVRIEDAGLMADAFPFLAGIFQRNGEITMLWNLHSQLGVRETPISSELGKNKIVVADWDDSGVGFLVDEIDGIAVLNRDDVESAGEGAGSEYDFLEGIARTENGAVGLLSLSKLLYNLPV
jgi:chemotaxis signal transduction protein